MSLLTVVLVIALVAPTGFVSQKLGESRRPTAPESFSANLNAAGGEGAVASRLVIKVDRYSAAADRDAVVQALRTGGHAAFLDALRRAPTVGTLTLAGETFSIRWAREERSENARTIVLVTDKPVYLVGGGSVAPKPREGYDVAILKFRIDDAGLGYNGEMAAAARVKVSGPTGLEIDDYAGSPVKLATINRTLQ